MSEKQLAQVERFQESVRNVYLHALCRRTQQLKQSIKYPGYFTLNSGRRLNARLAR